MKAIDRLLQNWRIAKARRYIAPGMRVLDIGCSSGELFRRVPEIADGVGIDPDLPQNTRSCPNAILVKGFFPQALPNDQPFDVITMLAVFEHVPPAHHAEFASSCARYLKPGGRLIITVPDPFVDKILVVLRALRLIHGMALEQHYGYEPKQTASIFTVPGMRLTASHKFQLGLNNLFVFTKTAGICEVSTRGVSAKRVACR